MGLLLHLGWSFDDGQFYPVGFFSCAQYEDSLHSLRFGSLVHLSSYSAQFVHDQSYEGSTQAVGPLPMTNAQNLLFDPS